MSLLTSASPCPLCKRVFLDLSLLCCHKMKCGSFSATNDKLVNLITDHLRGHAATKASDGKMHAHMPEVYSDTEEAGCEDEHVQDSVDILLARGHIIKCDSIEQHFISMTTSTSFRRRRKQWQW